VDAVPREVDPEAVRDFLLTRDGVVVEFVVLRQGFAKRYGRRRRREGGRAAPGEEVRPPSHPPLYIGKGGEGAGPLDPI
jgi:hypothetical protein